MTDITLRMNVEETSTLPQVQTAQEVRDHNGPCFCELLPAIERPASEVFPGHEAVWTGERGPPEWWLDEDSNVVALHLFKLTDVYLFPAFGVVVRANGDVMHYPMQDAAYMSPDLTQLPFMTRRGDTVVFAVPDSLERIERAAHVMALGAKVNYGHFMLDCLPAAASIRKTGMFQDYPFHVPPLRGWQKQHFDLLGIAPVELRGDVYHVKDLIYTSCLHHYLHTPNFNYQDVREHQLKAAAMPPRDQPSRIYLSRANYPNRTLMSDSALRRRLAALGFVAIDPSTLSVREQIAVFNGAEVIVGSAGAGFANVLYCKPGTLVVEIQPTGMQNQWVRNICLHNRCRFVAYFCDALDADPVKPETSLRFDIDVERFMGVLAGFPPLNGPPPRNGKGWLSNFKEVMSAFKWNA